MDNLLLNFETTKLFYNEYLYKVVVKNHIGAIFRAKNLNHARNELDRMQTQLDEEKFITRTFGIRTEPVSQQDFETSKTMFKMLSTYNQNDYKLRIEGANTSIYSNDIDIIHNICSKVPVTELWKPNDAYKDKLDKNTILTDYASPYNFKVTLNANKIDPAFYKWIQRNSDKIKIGKTALECVGKGFALGFYFFVKNEKVLQLISLMIGHNFQTVQRIVCKQDLDK